MFGLRWIGLRVSLLYKRRWRGVMMRLLWGKGNSEVDVWGRENDVWRERERGHGQYF